MPPNIPLFQYSLLPFFPSSVLGLTAAERWAAARQMSPRSVPQQWFVLVGLAVMLVLLVLLIAISVRRHQQSQGQRAQKFEAEARRRGLSARERHILLALALRSGLRRTHGIFHTLDAFNRGAVQLLAECAQTRTLQENGELKAEVLRLRQKLGFQPGPAARGAPAPGQRSSREIPLGKYLELTGRSDRGTVVLRTEVLRNDEIELVVALPAPLPSRPGDDWLGRYYCGLSAWEFRTSTVRCDGQRLVLNHSEDIHFINRRRFPRVSLRVPALVAHLPLVQRAGAPGDRAAAETGEGPQTPPVALGNPDTGHGPRCAAALRGAPTRSGAAGGHETLHRSIRFVDSVVTEFAGPGLRIETRLPVQVDDRVLVLWRLAPDSGAGTLAALGRVKHGQDVARGVGIPDAIDRVWEGASLHDPPAWTAQPLSIAVELTGLSDEEVDELALLVSELSSPGQEIGGDQAAGPQVSPAYARTTG